MTPPPRELVEFLHRYDPSVQSLALGLRTVIHEELAPCHEHIFAMRSKVAIVYSATEKVMADGICYIGVNTKHVTLGFTRGVDLTDPAGILEGDGKAMRHIKVRKLSELDRPELRAYLREARQRSGAKRRTRRAPAGVVTTVKQSAAPKRPAPAQSFYRARLDEL
jgi:hypothetical protein